MGDGILGEALGAITGGNSGGIEGTLVSEGEQMLESKTGLDPSMLSGAESMLGIGGGQAQAPAQTDDSQQ